MTGCKSRIHLIRKPLMRNQAFIHTFFFKNAHFLSSIHNLKHPLPTNHIAQHSLCCHGNALTSAGFWDEEALTSNCLSAVKARCIMSAYNTHTRYREEA